MQVPKITIPGTWSHQVCKEEKEVAVVVVAAVEELMMVEPPIGDSNPNSKALLLDLQVGLIGETCQIQILAKFVDLLAHLDLDSVVLQSKMDPFGLVVHQEVAGEMTCQMAKWAMVAEVAIAAEEPDGVT